MQGTEASSKLTWPDLLEASSFAANSFGAWKNESSISAEHAQLIDSFYSYRREAWSKAAASGERVPADLQLAAPRADESAHEKQLRYWKFVEAEISSHQIANRLSLVEAHAARAQTQGRIASLQRRLSGEARPQVTAAPQERREVPRRKILEMLLDPRNIHWLLAFGGALMVTGLIILLWHNNFFTPPVLALSLGIANAAILVGGWAIIRYSRYQIAGRALTLLACLIMPLNLWYYHANHLLTIDGHLWVAALVISVLYAASAWVLRDELFVYVFSAGVALTGLLILADLPPSPQRFWEIASPATLLVALGLLAIHAERAFPDRESPFSRGRFGLAFFYSGQTLLAAGLLLLLGAQVASDWLYEPVFRHYYDLWNAERTPIVMEAWGQLLALALVVAGTYAYIYSDVVVRRVGIYVYLAAATLLWAEILGLKVLHLHLGIDALIAVLASTALVANVVSAAGKPENPLTRMFPGLGVLLGLLAVGLGLIVYFRALSVDLKSVWRTEPPAWSYVAAMLWTAVACRAGAHVTRVRWPTVSMINFFATGAATMVAAVACLAALGLSRWEDHAPWMMLLPIAYLIGARIYRGRPMEQPLIWVAHSATVVMLVSSVMMSVEGFGRIVEQQRVNLILALFFAEAALFYGLAVAWLRQEAALGLCVAAACGSVWQLLTYAGFQAEAYTVCFACLGLLMLLAYRLSVLDAIASGGLTRAAFAGGNALLSLSFVASIFIGASRLASHRVEWAFVGLCAVILVISALAVAIVPAADWRRWYVVIGVLQAMQLLLAIQALSTLSIYQKLEIFSVAAGLCLLVVGHIGWFRESEHENDLVSVSLLLGSLLAGLPLAIATLVDRWHDQFLILNELGFLTVSILLLATGFIFQLKSTTLTGAGLTIAYFLMLLLYVPWKQLNAVAISIAAGGGLLFGTGLLLSLYRDRLLALPEKIHRHEGVFRVLNWR
jgi:hypothetical protein